MHNNMRINLKPENSIESRLMLFGCKRSILITLNQWQIKGRGLA